MDNHPPRSHAFSKRGYIVATLLAMSLLLLTSCQAEGETASLVALEGRTMGTVYSVKIPVGKETSPQAVKESVDEVLAEVNRQMSTYLDDSEISRFNQAAADQWFEISPEFYQVLKLSQEISKTSSGAFDVTVGPVVNLWRFGPDKSRTEPPSEEEITAGRKLVGYQQLTLQADPPAVKKSQAEIYVDLSAIAKGYGSDQVARKLDELGFDAYLVEIGGEVVAKGIKPNGDPWRVGVEKPSEGARELQAVVPLRDIALATSGDYRNFHVYDGKRYSHTIDPTTAKPVTHDLASVSVLAKTCAEADAWATALLVLGPSQGYNLAEQLELAVLFQERSPEGTIRVQATPAWTRLQAPE
ncbi:MAG: FAD:protein FMN transferase [Pirellulaceae bacterium]